MKPIQIIPEFMHMIDKTDIKSREVTAIIQTYSRQHVLLVCGNLVRVWGL